MDELKKLSDRLSQLMADPHPGLITWKTALAKTLIHLAAYCGISPVCVDAAKLAEQPEYKL